MKKQAQKNHSLWGYFVGCLKNHYADFNGRAPRKEYYGFMLFYVLFLVVIIFLPIIITSISFQFFGLLFLIFLVSTFIPLLAVSARRLHDTNSSAWSLLLLIIFPPLKLLYFLWLILHAGTVGENDYGDDPREN